MVAVSVGTVVPGVVLTRPEWLAERISDMGISWGTGDTRVSGTLWWCMAASSVIDPVVVAAVAGRPGPDTVLEHLRCEIRPDGGVERVFADAAAVGDGRPHVHDVEQPDDAGARHCTESCCAGIDSDNADSSAVHLRETLARIIPVVAEVSGASVASLWAIVADAIGNRAIDAGDAEAGARLARQVAGRLPVPRFADIGARTFVRRISCCLVFEVPNCQMCTSCPKRPAAERQELLSALTAGG
ncbi:(2Fe-2S)-binding protein [Nocardia macrotermitis]|uniref:Ferric siderophore reductase C-terminal domain-containing protein n=1 Tax=Nocardia macrotermitis TaxID=2585198 RepID=A0A7K0D7T6_9NOCA|nr:(2Fe-2S)-binding protein [Nocardia macrotermitis]MQY21850.1 hypothetical protein [Nocardia macrotermitis]